MSHQEESRAHKILRIAAYPLVGLAFVYIFGTLWAYRDWLINWQPSAGGILMLIFACLIYGLSGFLLSGAWCKLNHICGQTGLSGRQCTEIYGTTQIAKYAPGNVFHFIGRHAAGVRAGLLHRTLACSASLEMFGLLFSAGLLSIAGVLILGSDLKDKLPLPLWLLASVALLTFLLMVAVLPRVVKKIGLPDELSTVLPLFKNLALVIGRYLVFFIVSGVLMVLVTFAVVDSVLWSSLMLVFFGYPVSWLAGYLIPGASAGIGVREATLMIILSVSLPPQAAALIAILMRAVTVVGDMVFYLVSKAIQAGNTKNRTVFRH